MISRRDVHGAVENQHGPNDARRHHESPTHRVSTLPYLPPTLKHSTSGFAVPGLGQRSIAERRLSVRQRTLKSLAECARVLLCTIFQHSFYKALNVEFFKELGLIRCVPVFLPASKTIALRMFSECAHPDDCALCWTTMPLLPDWLGAPPPPDSRDCVRGSRYCFATTQARSPESCAAPA